LAEGLKPLPRVKRSTHPGNMTNPCQTAKANQSQATFPGAEFDAMICDRTGFDQKKPM
jgi:hypothetical protein